MRPLFVVVLLAAGCAARATTAPAMTTALGPALAAARPASIFVGRSPIARPPTTTPPPPSTRRAVWVATTACLQPLGPKESGERAPAFDPKRCVGLVERVLVDADVPDADVLRVEQLTIEDVALKLETLVRAGAGSEGVE